MTMRSYLLPYAGKVLDPSNAAAADVALIDSCEAAGSCADCVAFSYQTLTCVWLPSTRQSVAAGTADPSAVTTRSPRPPPVYLRACLRAPLARSLAA